MENKYFSTSDYNQFTSNKLVAKITQNKLVNEFDLNKKIKHQQKMRNKNISTKAELKEEQDKILKIQTYDLLEKYNTIWDKISADIKKQEFDSEPVYNKNVLKTKIKFKCNEVTDFYDK